MAGRRPAVNPAGQLARWWGALLGGKATEVVCMLLAAVSSFVGRGIVLILRFCINVAEEREHVKGVLVVLRRERCGERYIRVLAISS